MSHAVKAVIYCRISRDPHGTELGVKRQQQDCEQLAEREGYDVLAVFVDDDRSAFTGKRRPEFESMRELIGGGGVDVVVAWHPDRLTRHPRELEDLIDLLETSHTTVRTVQTGEYDLGSPSGRMVARVIGAMARHESEHKSARLQRKHLELAENGANAGGGRRPFGFEPDRIAINETEAAVIRDMSSWILAGASLREVCRRLNDAGTMTTTGGTWVPIVVRRILLSARIAGLREHSRAGETDAVWDPIITTDDRLRLQVVLADPARRSGSGGREMKLLTGLLVCGLCGSSMMSRPRSDRRPTYRCVSGVGFSGCGGILVTREPLEEHVVASALDYIDSSETASASLPPDDDAHTLAELHAVAERSAELAAMWAAGEITRNEWAAASIALTRRQTGLENELRGNVAARTVDDLPEVAARWAELSVPQRRQLLAAVIERIVITAAVPGANKFDPERVEIVWKS